MTTQEQVYLDAQKACGLKVGDYVRVTRKAYDCEAGWDNGWADGMDKTVGMVGNVLAVSSDGIQISFASSRNGRWYFPYFVLEKVEKPECEFKPFDRVLVRDGAGYVWRPDIFSMYRDGSFPYYCMSHRYAYCIHYEGNEHLAGTTDAPE